ncbi:Asp23/Gls24 family envelope stress response protein [Corynebacterium lubricantis]|uniref:Asp23/Gls24 family envelope stress response protein n=1 Tax=Corynebacterium lubricantis TaxID=541095 RepID=UPI00037D0173|nr:Asp23/Gls24 family envelope stress response protein [Corynebacterium lubricantis]
MSSQPFKISERVFEKIATVATNSVPGAVKQDAKLAGLAGRSLPRFVATIDRQAHAVHFDAELAIAFPSPARAVVQEIRESIAARVESFTSFKVARINVTIASFVSDATGPRVTREDLRWHQTGIDARSIILPTFHVEYPIVQRRAALAPITVNRNEAISHVECPPRIPVQTDGFLDTVERIQLRPVSTPPPMRVTTPPPVEPQGLNQITVAPMQPLRQVSAPEFPERKVSVVPFQAPRRISAPQPISLKPITIHPFGGTQ